MLKLKFVIPAMLEDTERLRFAVTTELAFTDVPSRFQAKPM